MVLFFTQNIENSLAHFDINETKHIQNALRKSKGDTIHFIDGKGSFYEGKIIENTKRSLIAEIISKKVETAPEYKVHVAIAPTKNMDRIEWFVEKSIELGISEISFIQCKHSERKTLKIDRINRIAIAAIKQSMKASLPTINDIQNYDEWITHSKNPGYIATLHENTIPFFGALTPKKDITICIGPEGGFREDEVNLAISKDFQPVSLGPHRLRTETAGIYSVAHAHLKNL